MLPFFLALLISWNYLQIGSARVSQDLVSPLRSADKYNNYSHSGCHTTGSYTFVPPRSSTARLIFLLRVKLQKEKSR